MMLKQPLDVILSLGNDFRKCGFQMDFNKNPRFSVHHNRGFLVTEIFVMYSCAIFSLGLKSIPDQKLSDLYTS